ncbi:MAG: GAF domain-containing protein [Chloroflexia bacterium]|nr:GAF domain-containing protein [Chloroflexia bacterium]
MAAEISCRALHPLFQALNERGIPLSDLLGNFPEGHTFFCAESWISQATFAKLFDRAIALSGSPDLIAWVGRLAAEPCVAGLVQPQAVLEKSPLELLRQADRFLGPLQREGQVIVQAGRPGYVRLACLPPPGGRRSYHLCTYTRHLLAAIPGLWQIEDVQVREICCTVPLVELRPASGERYAIEEQGQVWQVLAQGEFASRRCLGKLNEDGTFQQGGTLYGAEHCLYEIRWSHPRSRRRSWSPRFVPRAHHCERALRVVQRQEHTIQALHEQIQHMQRTMEARMLERTEKLRAKARQSALVEQAGRRFASILDPQALWQEAVRTLREDLGYFSVAMYLQHENRWTLVALSSGDETVQRQIGAIFYRQAALDDLLDRSGRPLRQDDLEQQPHPLGLPRWGRGRSLLCVPLVASNRLLGILDLQSPLAGHLNEEDALLLYTLAPQIAIALERSLLYQEEQWARQKARAMANLARVVTTSLEMDQVLSSVLEQLRSVLPYDSAIILLQQGTRLSSGISHGLSPQAEHGLLQFCLKRTKGPLALLFQQGRSFLQSSPGGATGYLPPQLAHLRSWLGVSLTSRNTVIGAVILASQQQGLYGPEDLRLAEDLAGQVSTAIENARLYSRIRQERDRLESLYEIARQLHANLGIEDILSHVLELALTSVGALAGSIILLDGQGQLRHSILSRPGQDSFSLLQRVIREGAAAWVIREKQALLIRDTHSDSRWIELQGKPWVTRSAILVPLLVQDQILGVLTVDHPQVNRFNQDDLALLLSVASQASVVVQRAHLFAAIQNERARLEAVIEGTADAVVLLNESGQVLHMNHSAAHLFGLESPDPTSKSLDWLAISPALQSLITPQSLREGPRRAEIPLEDERIFYATLNPIPSVGAVLTMQDISPLKELDRLKSDFIATVSHDLRSPLGAVQTLTEMIEVAGPLNKDQRRFIEQVLFSVDKMIALVQDLLDLTRIEAGVEMSMAPCQLAAVIADAVDQVEALAAIRSVSLQVVVAPDLPLVWGNGRRLGQVITNLLDNAIKYSPSRKEVLFRAYPQGDILQVDVTDYGPGIPNADLPYVFEKFYTIRQNKPGEKGTGLGLSIARSIILAHGGKIWVKSKEGEGSTFSFSLLCRDMPAQTSDKL